jgi:hypothetical protein
MGRAEEKYEYLSKRDKYDPDVQKAVGNKSLSEKDANKVNKIQNMMREEREKKGSRSVVTSENREEFMKKKLKLSDKEKEIRENEPSYLDKHISDVSQGIKASKAMQTLNNRDNSPVENMKHIETDDDHQNIFNHLRKQGYEKMSGYDNQPDTWTTMRNADTMITKTDPVFHKKHGIQAHLEHEHGRKAKLHFHKYK